MPGTSYFLPVFLLEQTEQVLQCLYVMSLLEETVQMALNQDAILSVAKDLGGDATVLRLRARYDNSSSHVRKKPISLELCALCVAKR